MDRHYSKQFRVQVAKEAALPEYQGLEHVLAEKYNVKPWTVEKWKRLYLEGGEDALSQGHLTNKKPSTRELELEKENAKLREENEILKKAAAFLADLRRG